MNTHEINNKKLKLDDFVLIDKSLSLLLDFWALKEERRKELENLKEKVNYEISLLMPF